ncbi:MAG: DUF1592 domain-containing protein, partial [Planctomycetota bacterium]
MKWMPSPLLLSLHTRIAIAFFALALSIALAGAAFTAETGESRDANSVDPGIMGLLKQNCLRCHGPEESNADLRIDQLTSDLTDRENASAWVEVRNAINLGEMPPEDEGDLTSQQIRQVSTWVTAGLRAAERNRLTTDGRVLLRRLNRHEYVNTVSDLLHLRFPPGTSPLEVLPPDGTAEGFDKVSGALLLDPSLMQSYYEVARSIARRSIVDGPPAYPTETMRMEFEAIAESQAVGYLINRLGLEPVPGGLQLVEGSTRSFGLLRYPGRKDNNVAPVQGDYRFTVRAGADPGQSGETPRLRLTQGHPDDDMRLIMEFDVDAPWDDPKDYTVVLPRDALGGELKVSLVNATKLYMGQRPGEDFRRQINAVGKQGDYAETLRLTGRKVAEGWGGDRSTPDPEKLDLTLYPRVFLDYLEVKGPLYEQWPPKSHVELLYRGENADEDLEYARAIFARFLPKAWRRPVNASEVDSIVQLVGSELEHGTSFRDAIRVGVTATLTSPKFLYLLEPTVTQSTQPLNDYQVASRLSYFLWSSMPDQRLLELAAKGQLRDRQVLAAQVDRMLADPKVERFIDGFAGQWLRTETFLAFAPDRRLYPTYDESLAAAIVREPLEFFRAVLVDDMSALNFIRSDFV